MIDNSVRMRFRSRDRSDGSRRSRWLVPLIGIIAVVGCTGDDDAGSTTTEFASTTTTAAPSTTEEPTTTETPASTETATTTTGPVSTTERPSTTDSTSTTESPTTTAVRSTAPTTSALNLAPVETDVAAAYTAAFNSWTTCLEQLPACDLQSLAETRTDEYLGFATNQANLWNENGFTAANAESRRLTIESVTLSGDAQATVVSCEVDGAIMSNRAGEVVDEDFESSRRASVLRSENGIWLVAGTEVLEVADGEENSVCDG